MKVWNAGEFVLHDDLNKNFASLNAGVVSISSFGAKFDGASDDTAAWSAALTYLAGQGGVWSIRLPPGRSVIRAPLSITVPFGTGIEIEGSGDQTTDLYFPGTDGLVIVMTGWQAGTSRAGGIALRDFSVTRGVNGGYANRAISITGQGMVQTRVAVENVGVRGADYNSGWLLGLELKNVLGARVSGFRSFVYGAPIPSTTAPTVGIAIHADGLPSVTGAPNNYTVDTHISDLVMTGGDRGIVANGWCQGIYVTDASIIANNVGIDVGQGAYGAAGGELELLSMRGGTIYSVHRCIRSLSGGLHSVQGVLLQPSDQLGLTDQWSAVELCNANYVTLTGNTIQGLATQTGLTSGVRLVGNGSEIAICGNTFDKLNDAAVMTTGGADNNFTAVTIDGNAFRDVGKSNNPIIPRQALTNNQGQYVSVGSNYMNGFRFLGLDYMIDTAGNFVQAPGSSTALGTNTFPIGGVQVQNNVVVGGTISAANVSASGYIGLPKYTVAALPAVSQIGWQAYATNGRKAAEGAGAGTGVPVFYDGAHWVSCMGGTVTA